ncbi:MAG: glycosyltransferase family 2 protein [Syntrophomonadaceae bacterium]|nr:glycosyltransferase family 2 protein [Syntrophomonadaceae bacterium]
MPNVTVVVPAYNEEKRIVSTIEAIRDIPLVDQIIVVNDGSSDNTSTLARKAGAEVIDLQPNRGKGGAMNAVLPRLNADVIVFLDADLGYSAGEAAKLIEPVLTGSCDLAIAAFPPPSKKGGFGLVKGTAARALRRAGMSDSTAPLSGQRAMTAAALKAVTPFHEAYGVELGMTIRALEQGLRVLEIPTTMTHNETGRDLQGFLHRGRQFLNVLQVLREMRRVKR